VGKKGKPPKALNKKELVVDAGRKLFLREGFGATSMDAVALEAGVSKATVYSYFTSKEAFFAEIMEGMCRELGGNSLDGASRDSPAAFLKDVGLFGVRRLLQTLDLAILRRVVAESQQFPALGETFWTTGPRNIKEFVADYLREQHRRGTLYVPDADKSAMLFLGLTMGIYLLPLLLGIRKPPEEKEIHRDLEQVISGFLTTLAPRNK